ncbi:MAG: energy transducer TonB [Flavobacteriaceae bacterium]
MKIMKNLKSNVKNYSKLFMQLGLILALFMTYVAIEKKTFDRQFGDLGNVTMNANLEKEPSITERIEFGILKTLVPPTPEKNEIDRVPVFPGCKGTKAELKACFNINVQKHFVKNFNSNLPNKLVSSPGKKEIIVLFKVDKKGNVTDVEAKAPNSSLRKEAIRIIKMLPKMIPGEKDGKVVSVKYTLPMLLDVKGEKKEKLG